MIEEWRVQHKAELLANWERATSKMPLIEIHPLE